MANRELRNWCLSNKINKLTSDSEVFFIRLIMNVDDYGIINANLLFLQRYLYPIKDVSTNEILNSIKECSNNGLIIYYRIDSSDYIKINNFKQRIRQKKSKHPEPDNGILIFDIEEKENKYKHDNQQLTCNNQDLMEKCQTNVRQMTDKCLTNKKSIKFDFAKALISIGVNENIAIDWTNHRRRLKATNTESTFNMIYKQILKSGLSANECVSEALNNSWRGFKSEWINNKQNNNGQFSKQFNLGEQVGNLVKRVHGECAENITNETNGDEFTEYREIFNE